MSILIKNVFHENSIVDVLIERNYISRIAPSIDFEADTVIDGTDKAISPGFINCHTHSSMTLFRGVGDDVSLEKWLHEIIWPLEAKLNEEDIYCLAKLAILEMIKSGTTCFYDMYWFEDFVQRAADEMGIRSVLSMVIMHKQDKSFKEITEDIIAHYDRFKKSELSTFALGPHAIYTNTTELLTWVRDFAVKNDLLIHTHLAETKQEYDDCVERFGLSPVRYLNSIGMLSPRLTIAHCLWLDDEEIQMLASNDVKVVHNPNSNLKLASGYKFHLDEMTEKGINVGIGTDGCGSSNNLDMTEAMKVASLLGKGWRFDPKASPAHLVYKCATENGGKILHQNIGKLQEGYLADVILFDLNTPAFIPNHDFICNVVYAANGSNVDTVICNGKILMQNRKVEHEDEIMRDAKIRINNILKDVSF